MPPRVEERAAVREDSFSGRVLGYPVYELVGGLESAWQELQRVAAGKPAMAYVKVSVGETKTLNWLMDHDWQLVDTSIQLEKAVSLLYRPETSGVSFRLARDNDEEPVAEIARESFTCSRWHRDEHIPNERANALKEAWVRNFWRGQRGDYMIVAEISQRIVGFHQVVRQDDSTLLVDLIAVDGAFRGRNIGLGMLVFAEQHCGAPKVIRVGTQLANWASLAMYQRNGFLITSASHVWHYRLPAK